MVRITSAIEAKHISQIFPFIVLFSRIDLQQRCQPPPVSAHPVCCDRSRGTPRHENTGECIEVDGGSIHPRTPILKRTTHATAHSRALQMHKALPKMTESASAAATNVVALPDPAALGPRQAVTPPHQKERLRSSSEAMDLRNSCPLTGRELCNVKKKTMLFCQTLLTLSTLGILTNTSTLSLLAKTLNTKH